MVNSLIDDLAQPWASGGKGTLETWAGSSCEIRPQGKPWRGPAPVGYPIPAEIGRWIRRENAACWAQEVGSHRAAAAFPGMLDACPRQQGEPDRGAGDRKRHGCDHTKK